jgi:hypothetical protein
MLVCQLIFHFQVCALSDHWGTASKGHTAYVLLGVCLRPRWRSIQHPGLPTDELRLRFLRTASCHPPCKVVPWSLPRHSDFLPLSNKKSFSVTQFASHKFESSEVSLFAHHFLGRTKRIICGTTRHT